MPLGSTYNHGVNGAISAIKLTIPTKHLTLHFPEIFPPQTPSSYIKYHNSSSRLAKS